MTHKLKIAAYAALAVAAAAPALATENGNTNYPTGAPGTYLSSFPPITGLFALNQTSYTFADGLYDNNGKKQPGNFHVSAAVDTVRLLAAYPVDFFGGRLYQQVVIPIGTVHATNASPFPGASFRGTSSGTSNITVSPVILSFFMENAQFSTGVDVATPLGSYDSTSPVTLATGYASIIPVVAYHYNKADSWDVALGTRALLNLRNPTNGYQSGNTLATDFQISYNFGKLNLGVVGGYQVQLNADKTNGPVNFGRFEQLNFGPSIQYQFGPVSANLNFQPGIYARNTSKQSTVWLNVAIPLQIAGPFPLRAAPAEPGHRTDASLIERNARPKGGAFVS